MTKEQEIIYGQLTLRMVVWDISDMAGVDDKKLEKEMELFRVCRVMMSKMSGKEHGIRYEGMVKSLRERGISEEEALLVTEDAGMAEYVYGLRNAEQEPGAKGMGIVFYEKEGSRTDVSADMIVLGFEEIGVQFLDRVQKRRNRLPWNVIYTERTCVREITMDDLDELYALYEGEGITDYTEPLFERQKEEEYTRNYIDCMYYYYGYGMWVIRDRRTGKLIGRAGIEHREIEGNVLMELGYIIGRDYQNQGYATEVCQKIIAYAGQELGVEELHCFIHPRNLASVHLAKKLGFEPDPERNAGWGEMLHFRKYTGGTEISAQRIG